MQNPVPGKTLVYSNDKIYVNLAFYKTHFISYPVSTGDFHISSSPFNNIGYK